MKVLTYSRFSYELIATSTCHIFVFPGPPALDTAPIMLGDGKVLAVGDRLSVLGGRKTSAGFSQIRMFDGCWLEFAGTFRDLDGTAILFRQSQGDDPLAFYGGYEAGLTPLTLVFSTPGYAGRLIETTLCSRYEDA